MADKRIILFSILLLTLVAFAALWYEPASSSDPIPVPQSAATSQTLPISPKSGSPSNALEIKPSEPSSKEQVIASALKTKEEDSSLPSLEQPKPIEQYASLNPPSTPTIPKSLPAQPLEEPLVKVITEGPTTSKEIAITFDDGPHPTLTPRVLEILRERNIKATFFVLGDRVKLYPAVLKEIAAEGHEIGNHTYDHRLLTAMSDELIEKEITTTQDEIKDVIGYTPHLFRPPYGAFRPRTKSIFREHDLNVVLWSVDPKDWQVRNSQKVFHFVVKETHNGSIILCHDIHKTTVDALPEMLDALLDEGYHFHTVSDLCGLTTTTDIAKSTAVHQHIEASSGTSPIPARN